MYTHKKAWLEKIFLKRIESAQHVYRWLGLKHSETLLQTARDVLQNRT